MSSGATRASAVTPETKGQAFFRWLFYWMPFLFGVGFIAPLIAQTMAYWDIAAPFGLSRIVFGLLIGAPWGLLTVWRGRWF